MTGDAWTITTGQDPVVATAIHAGHDLRDEVATIMHLSEADRLREEDPFTDRWVGIAANRVVVHRSRFEVDLNRSRERAVYATPADAWGLDVWRHDPPRDLLARSLDLYDSFYGEFAQLCDDVVERHGRIVVLDLHSYNHRRAGPDHPAEDPDLNPEINLGTKSIVDAAWNPIVEAFGATLRRMPFYDGNLDVRTNVRFTGGNLSRWVNARYGPRGCSIAVEMKKLYMDEWTGEPDEGITSTIGRSLDSAATAVREALM